MPQSLFNSATFWCVSCPDAGRLVNLQPQSRLLLGRDLSADIQLTDPAVTATHLSLLFDDQCIHFQTVGSQTVDLNGEPVLVGPLGLARDLQVGTSHWRLLLNTPPPGAKPLNPFGYVDLSNSYNRLSALTGIDRLDSDFSLKSIFGRIGEKRSDEGVENAFTVGTRQTTPLVGTVASHWPQPWLFLRFGGSALLIFIGSCLAVTQFKNELLIPGLLFVGSFTVPFGSLIFFWEMNAPQNVSLYQTIKLLFSSGLVSLLISVAGYPVSQ